MNIPYQLASVLGVPAQRSEGHITDNVVPPNNWSAHDTAVITVLLAPLPGSHFTSP